MAGAFVRLATCMVVLTTLAVPASLVAEPLFPEPGRAGALAVTNFRTNVEGAAFQQSVAQLRLSLFGSLGILEFGAFGGAYQRLRSRNHDPCNREFCIRGTSEIEPQLGLANTSLLVRVPVYESRRLRVLPFQTVVLPTGHASREDGFQTSLRWGVQSRFDAGRSIFYLSADLGKALYQEYRAHHVSAHTNAQVRWLYGKPTGFFTSLCVGWSQQWGYHHAGLSPPSPERPRARLLGASGDVGWRTVVGDSRIGISVGAGVSGSTPARPQWPLRWMPHTDRTVGLAVWSTTDTEDLW